MAQRSLEITIISAKDLKNVKHLSKMDVYVTASISGDHRTEQKTPVNKHGGTSPEWNHTMKFKIDEAALLAQMNHLFVIFKIKCERSLRGDREIGEVNVAVKELLDSASEDHTNSPKNVTYTVRLPSGEQKGELNFRFKFGDNEMGTAPIAVAYSAPPQDMAYPPVGYQPAVHGGSLPQKPPAGYPPVGYYPPVVQPHKQKQDEFGGFGLEAAFVGGVVGGLLVTENVAAASYELGFNAGNNKG